MQQVMCSVRKVVIIAIIHLQRDCCMGRLLDQGMDGIPISTMEMCTFHLSPSNGPVGSALCVYPADNSVEASSGESTSTQNHE